MTAAISPEGNAPIVGGLFFLCSAALVQLACAPATAMRRAAQRRADDEVEQFRAELDRERDLVKAIGRVPAETRWAA